MTIQTIGTKNAPAAIGPYSQAVLGGNLLFVSGQLGLLPESGKFVGSDLSSQAAQALENMKQIVEAGGSDMAQILTVDVFLKDISGFGEFNGVYEKFFMKHRPARAVVEVSNLPKGALVEIKCIAAAGAV
jgi:2-iminobutanoate/2-iminopropanoate deaminase